MNFLRTSSLAFALLVATQIAHGQTKTGENPIIRNMFTADPAPLVVGDTVYLYTGHDVATGQEMFNMSEWLCFSSQDMKTWTPRGPIMKPTDFKWAVKDAWAAQVVQKGGKFYLYATVQHDNTSGGKAIGVAVSDNPTGPFVDARGTALVTDKTTPSPNGWDDIDPTVFIDDDGTPWLAWGNPNCYLVKLKPNMTELDGPIQRIFVPNYTEGPWLSKRDGLYYLTYAAFAHQGTGEKICYATATNITGPWTYRGILTGGAKNSYTIHPGIVDFKGQSYFFYHNAALTLPDGQTGATGRRAVAVEYLYYNPDGTIQPIAQTVEGVSGPPHPAPFPSFALTQNSGAGATRWPGTPQIATTDNPLNTALIAVGFNGDGGVNRIGQTFRVDKTFALEGVVLYAGDGVGTDAQNSVTLALYDLGTLTANAANYAAGNNLLGAGQGLKVDYQVQAPGLLQFDFGGINRVTLQAGHSYAFEIQGEKNSLSMFWRRTRTDVYAGGGSFRDRSKIEDRDKSTGDLAMAIYGK